ncbi:hypothetical protein [Helicobacter pylori]|uniref:hypothetical protein n=1 Tax=Helicobacter pylori TaxID=210 RepID=UPI00283AB1F7|nr:hypothetical protein [Helicobacter pylori]WJI96829.1 hypothetical protein QAP00_07185 [Helicobacter pylori]
MKDNVLKTINSYENDERIAFIKNRLFRIMEMQKIHSNRISRLEWEIEKTIKKR